MLSLQSFSGQIKAAYLERRVREDKGKAQARMLSFAATF
jgi:hypothetical protein